MTDPARRNPRRNRRVALASVGVIVGMLGLSAAAVPLYDLFCRVTGYGGTTGVADEGSTREVTDVVVEVSFNADVDPDLPWSFRPLQRATEVKVGENSMAFYEAVNNADHAVVGRATYNVTPHKVGYYFNKMHCFCFDEQVLEPGERVEMPVSFFVDPAMLEDANTEMTRQITLSYTFFVDEEATAELREAERSDETASSRGSEPVTEATGAAEGEHG